MILISKLERLLKCFYRVPWCVPAWGWGEFSVTVSSILQGKICDGPYPKRLSEAIGRYLGVSYVIPVNRGRTALTLALKSLGIENKDEVILPSYVCRSVLDAVLKAGAKPVFADVGPDLHVTPKTVSSARTDRTKCLIVPHLFGNTAPIDEIEGALKGSGIFLIDDAAQSFGSRRAGRPVGTFGDCGIISCGPGKTLAGAAGGLLVTNRREVYDRARSIALHREKWATILTRVISFWMWRRFRRYTLPFKVLVDRIKKPSEEGPFEMCAISNLDAGIALHQFYSLDRNVKERRENAREMTRRLGALRRFVISDFSTESTLVKLVLSGEAIEKDQLSNGLGQLGIECQGGYTPLHRARGEGSSRLPQTERVWEHVLCIPVDLPYKGQAFDCGCQAEAQNRVSLS